MTALPYSVRQIPVFGDDIYQVGQVLTITEQACGPDPWILVSGFFTYIPQFVWSFVKPEPEDQIGERFGRRHKRIRRRRFHVYDIDPVPKNGPPGLYNIMYKSFKLKERAGWYLNIVDATSDFLVNWTSLAYTWSGCTVPDSSQASAWGAYGFLAQSFGPHTTIIGGTDSWYQNNAFAGTTQASVYEVGPKQYSGSATLKLNPIFGQTGQINRVYMVADYGGGVKGEIDMEKQGTFQGGQTYTSTQRIYLETLGGVTVHMFCDFTTGQLVSQNMTLNVQGAPYGGLDADP